MIRTEVEHCDVATLRQIAPKDVLPEGNYVRLSVCDDGCGIGASNLDRIFDPFFTTKARGRGLGLAAVKGIVASHGGAIRIKSKPGEGTTFQVLLPINTPPERCESPPEPAPLGNARKRILVVDDDDSLRTIVCRWLKQSGFDYIEAADGQEAIETFCKSPQSIDCVLLDLSMPKQSGDQVHREIKIAREDIPVILMSGYAERDILERFDGIEPTGFLQKPVPARDIVTAVREAVDTR